MGGVLRLGTAILAGALLLAAPAQAQFGLPYGGTGYLTAPEAASGAMGAGAGHSAATQQQCLQQATGRNGSRGVCTPGAPAPEPSR